MESSKILLFFSSNGDNHFSAYPVSLLHGCFQLTGVVGWLVQVSSLDQSGC